VRAVILHSLKLVGYEQPSQAFLRPIPHLSALPAHGVDEQMRVSFSHGSLEGWGPSRRGMRLGKELGVGRNDQTDGT
jgi:hypothetical protein